MQLIDTHTHFDVSEFDENRLLRAKKAYDVGVRHILLIGYLQKYFSRMLKVQAQLQSQLSECDEPVLPQVHLAFGLHPLYIAEQNAQDLEILEDFVKNHQPIAIGEVGLDTYPEVLKESKISAKQEAFFVHQIKLAKMYNLPILLHIRKKHSDVLRLLASHHYDAHKLGGIAHSFSGGEQEALAFVKRGFKLGITGQITNPNAKKLHRAVLAVYQKYGAQAFVIETDCPDMMPLPCQGENKVNEPVNLPIVLEALAQIFKMDKIRLAEQLWQNSCEALRVNWVR